MTVEAGKARGGLLLVLLLSWGWALVQAFRIAHLRIYGVDETTYAHGAWLVAQGQVPYRDFFFHHFPGVLEILSLVFRVSEPSTEYALLLLRGVTFLAFTVLLLSLQSLNRDRNVLAWIVLPLLTVVFAPFSAMVLEIRPDSFAFVFFVASVAVYRSAPGRTYLAGLLLALALWTSEKVAVYGAPFAVLILSDIRSRRAREVALSAIGCATVFFAWTIWNSTWTSFWEWCFEWNLVHESLYPKREWSADFRRVVSAYWWIFVLGAIGLWTSRGERLFYGALLVMTFLSYSVQQGAYIYSLIPFSGVVVLMASRGLAALGPKVTLDGESRSWWPPLAAVPLLSLALWAGLQLPIPQTNARQREVQKLLAHHVPRGKCVFDSSGAAVTYPSAHFYYFTDSLVRREKGELLALEFPRAIQEKQCAAMLVDFRFYELPSSLRAFLTAYFKPVTPELWIRSTLR